MSTLIKSFERQASYPKASGQSFWRADLSDLKRLTPGSFDDGIDMKLFEGLTMLARFIELGNSLSVVCFRILICFLFESSWSWTNSLEFRLGPPLPV